jgi:hypothetical protein
MMKKKNSNIETLISKKIRMTQIINTKLFGTLKNLDLDIVSDFEFRICKIGGSDG